MLAYLDGDPVAGLSCVWSQDWGSVEHVQTREQFRRRGICTAMLRFMQARAAESGAQGLYLYDTIDDADRIYAREGFRLVARPSQVHLWRELGSAET
ncbi:MAG: GNAT family N-acetyltransferase [Armatimonadetes bacterium]|nr:GNAT family N-acetyltransferase [Armatimonadota bacterium]